MKVLSRLLDSFPERDVSDEAKLNRMRAYMIAVEGIATAVLEEAERRVYRGQGGFERDLMPTPPAFAKLCRAIVAERYRAEHLPVGARLERFDAAPTPEMIERFGGLLNSLSEAADIARHETREEWLARMGDLVKLCEPEAA